MEYNKDIDVCTNDEARAYFKNKGLKYDFISKKDIHELADLIKEEVKKSIESGEATIDKLRINNHIDISLNDYGIRYAFIYMDSDYFTKRECISFNADGFIGFAGWASTRNANPIKRAFLKWCDKLELRLKKADLLDSLKKIKELEEDHDLLMQKVREDITKRLMEG